MSFLEKYHYFLLIIILAFSFFTRVVRISQPPEYIFDEVYHALTAKLISRDDPRAYEWWNPPVEPKTSVDWLHPPLAKYTQALSIAVFGENSFGWRFSSVIFGVLVIFMTYKMAIVLFENQNLALLASFLASLDGLLLTQSRIAMNDIHVTFFILLTFFLYYRYKKSKSAKLLLATGISGGLALASKWSGLFAILTVGFFEGIELIKEFILSRRQLDSKALSLIKKSGLLLAVLVILPAIIYLTGYSDMFGQGKSFSHFYELHKQIFHYQTNLTATHPYQSRPWQWFINSRPAWYYVKYSPEKIANIYAQGNHALFWIGDIAIFATVLTLGLGLIKRNKKIYHPALPFLLFAYFAVWLPWQLSPRIMFFYHYTPAVPLLSIILAYWLIKVSQVTIMVSSERKIKAGLLLAVLVLALCILNFIVFYPNWTGLTVPTSMANNIYFIFKSWK